MPQPPRIEPTEAAVRAALGGVVDPCSIATGVPINLEDMGLLQQVRVQDGLASIRLQLTSPICWQAANIMRKIEEAVGALPGIVQVECTLDAHAEWLPHMMAPRAQQELRRLRPYPMPQAASPLPTSSQ